MNDAERQRLLTDLTADREELLAVARTVDREALDRPTRNPGWTVRHVLAHVLAADADLVSILGMASDSTGDIRVPGAGEHEREMARWMTATPESICEELRKRGDHWKRLMIAMPEASLAATAGVGEGERTVGDLVSEWRGHDVQHREDVSLA